MSQVECRRIVVEGLVQGVGFRPFIYREATSRGLRGQVRNDGAGVVIDVEGDANGVVDFVREIQARAPALASITHLHDKIPGIVRYSEFTIVQSERGDARGTLVSPDIATCSECLAELFDPANRRFRYPFLNCTQCGPRFTIQQTTPYDREHTTMCDFDMCAACRDEYEDPQDRRFHAQPTACPECGPTLRLCDVTGVVSKYGDHALLAAVAAIREGKIVAIKGLGGYHLACDATSPSVVARLRAAKNREARPLAVMVTDATGARAVCEVTAAEEIVMQTAAAPIVVMRKRTAAGLADNVAPDCPYLGVMLPYTPLHHLLIKELRVPIVLTSGNRRDEPIAVDDADALNRLAGIADLFLMHDRPIAIRCDDSVMRVQATGPVFLRRSRGHAPRPIPMSHALRTPVLGVGGILKNTFCLARGNSAFMSQHVGDLTDPLAYQSLRASIDHFSALFDAHASVIAHDMHPDYASTRVALEMDCDERIAVQHHYAHVAGCIAENGITEEVLGVAFDGAGLGVDGAVWGGEFMLVKNGAWNRIAHLSYVPLPGGDGAARTPKRMAASHLLATYGPELNGSPVDCESWFSRSEWKLLRAMIEKGLHSPPTSSMGRLFDAMAVVSGTHASARFEGEAAGALEYAADLSENGAYPFSVSTTGTGWIAECSSVIAAAAEEGARGQRPGTIAARFHNSVCDLIVDIATRVREEHGVRHVALTGGVFQNSLLTRRAVKALATRGFVALTHWRVPCNDGGLSFGQVAAVAALKEAY